MSVNVFVVAAICGNWWVESGVNPGIWENLTVGAPGYGLGQWTDITTQSGSVYRRTQLFNYLSANGYAQDSGDGQLAFFLYENYWIPGSSYYGNLFTDLQDFLSYVPASPTNQELETLTYAFQQGWEMPIAAQPIRYQYALDVLNYLVNNINNPRVPWVSGNYYLPAGDRYSNCMLIYDYLNGYIPPTPPTPTVLPNYLKAGLKHIMKKRKKGLYDPSKRKRTILF